MRSRHIRQSHSTNHLSSRLEELTMSKDISLTKHVANAGSASHHNRNTTEELVNYSRGSCCHARYHYRLRSILVVCLSVTRWDGVFGQRSIVSLGSRLQKRPGSSSSQSMDGTVRGLAASIVVDALAGRLALLVPKLVRAYSWPTYLFVCF